MSSISQPSAGFYSNLSLVPKKDGGQRPVINLTALNKFLQSQHFKMEGIHTLRDIIKPGDWLAKVDLKDAFFTIPIDQPHRKHLRFSFQGRAYQFNCLPFGLTSAPWVFTKTLKPVVSLLRELGVRIVVYIDDMLILAETTILLALTRPSRSADLSGRQYRPEGVAFLPCVLAKQSRQGKPIVEFLPA